MNEVFQFLASHVEFGEFYVPVAVMIAGGFAILSPILNRTWPSIVGGLLLIIVYILPE